MAAGNEGESIRTDGGAYVRGNVDTRGGHFIGRDLKFIVQVYSPGVLPKKDQGGEIAAEQTALFHPGHPFGLEDSDGFLGRGQEIDRVISQVRDRRARGVAIFGPADVGKTSLLAAGVIPRLRQEYLVVFLHDYAFATLTISAELHGHAKQLGFSFDAGLSLPELVKAVMDKTGLKILLILDQFERFYYPNVTQFERDALKEQLGQIFSMYDAGHFQVMISLREEFQSELDRTWGNFLPDIREDAVHLGPFSVMQAQQIIETALNKPEGIAFDEESLQKVILPDLDRLDGAQDEKILPADLQIVCYCLYKEATAQKAHPYLDSKLYFSLSNGKGAEQFIDTYLDRLIQQVSVPRRPLAREILSVMADTLKPFWVSPGGLTLKGYDLAEIEATMREMVQAGMLIWHYARDEQSNEYAFASNSIARSATRLAGPDVIKRQHARNELEYAWRAWITYDAWASKEQLRHIEKFPPAQPCPPEKALFLLRSAVTRKMPTDFWLNLLNTEQAQIQLRAIEEQTAGISTEQNQLCLLVGVPKDEPFEAGGGFGPIALSAARSGEDSAQAAALAMLIAYREQAVPRLEAAMQKSNSSGKRLAAVRGVLSDASPELAAGNRSLPLPLRLRTWGWRFGRCIEQDLVSLLVLSLGGGVAAGFLLGVVRALFSWMVYDTPGIAFYSEFPTGVILGFTLVFSVLAARLVPLPPVTDGIFAKNPRYLPYMLLLGGTVFGLIHTFLVILLYPQIADFEPLLVPFALIGGMALSLAVSDLPSSTGMRVTAGGILRIALAMLVFGLLQFAFWQFGKEGASLLFVRNGLFYESRLVDTLINWKMDGFLDLVGVWFNIVAIIDSAMTALVLSAGMRMGVGMAYQWYVKWRTVLHQMIDAPKGE